MVGSRHATFIFSTAILAEVHAIVSHRLVSYKIIKRARRKKGEEKKITFTATRERSWSFRVKASRVLRTAVTILTSYFTLVTM